MAMRRNLKDVAASTRMVLDDRKFKTKTAFEELWDSLKSSSVQVVSKSFNKSIEQAFNQVDLNDSRTIDKAEFYAGILLLYHKM